MNVDKKLLVIFRGINVDYFDPTTKTDAEEKELLKSWNINENKKIILLPGRLTSWKGQELFLEAINLVNIQLGYEAFYAVILGSNQGRDLYKKKLIRLSEQYRMTKQVKFINHCKEMPLAYSIADSVVSASIEPEAFGRVSVEAQAMEKPIIASNLGGSKETILNKKSGFLYKHDDPRELAKTLNTVIELDQDALNSIGNEGRKNIIKKFDVESMCDSTLREYKKLLNI